MNRKLESYIKEKTRLLNDEKDKKFFADCLRAAFLMGHEKAWEDIKAIEQSKF